MSLSAIAGQERPLRRLKSLLASRRLPPALLFQGPRGVGKAATALQLAKALNCSKRKTDCCDTGAGACRGCQAAEKGIDPDIHRVDAAYQAALLEEDAAKQRSIRIDTVRHLIADLEMRSLEGRWKAAILDDAHTLVPAAANAMLKALEEPPLRTLWILVTHRPGELLSTIRSRCQQIPFGPLPVERVAELLAARGVAADEAQAAARLAEGSLGRAIELIEDPQPEPAAWLSDPLAPFKLADELPRGLALARPVVEERLRRMAWHVRSSRGPEGFASSAVRAVLRELSELRRALRSNADPRLVLELAALQLQRLKAAGGLPS
ncbi:MAG: DNA polymerase III subunit delta' [Elusimicrobiota bacterium]